MNKLLLGTVLAAFALSSTASAGSLKDPVIEQDVIATQAAASSAPGLGLLLLLTVVITASTLD